MTSRAWHIVRWFGFLAIGLAIAIGSGLRFRQAELAGEPLPIPTAPADETLAANPPRPWLAPDTIQRPTPPSLPPALDSASPETSLVAVEPPAAGPFDPESPEAEQAIDELGMALAGFDVENVQFSSVDEGGRRRFVFRCDVPTDQGPQTFAGEGPDPPSAARHALSRIRAWAATPGPTTLR
jgi:hypothetical protein